MLTPSGSSKSNWIPEKSMSLFMMTSIVASPFAAMVKSSMAKPLSAFPVSEQSKAIVASNSFFIVVIDYS